MDLLGSIASSASPSTFRNRCLATTDRANSGSIMADTPDGGVMVIGTSSGLWIFDGGDLMRCQAAATPFEWRGRDRALARTGFAIELGEVDGKATLVEVCH